MVLLTEDDGKGISAELLGTLGNQTVDSSGGTGTALWNIKKRIEEIYGQNASFQIESSLNKGTKVSITLPLTQQKWGEDVVKGFYCG
jgi:two-component system, LytTR family, sensor histidine kinase LytS